MEIGKLATGAVLRGLGRWIHAPPVRGLPGPSLAPNKIFGECS